MEYINILQGRWFGPCSYFLFIISYFCNIPNLKVRSIIYSKSLERMFRGKIDIVTKMSPNESES